MSIYLDTKYLNLVSPRLRNFSKHNERLWNCSCPICGDSKKDETKARGYLFPNRDILVYKCHNCGVSMSFRNFLKNVNPNLYKQYVFESLKEANLIKDDYERLEEEKLIKTFEGKQTLNTCDLLQDDVLSSLTRIDKLPDSHFAKQYVISRKIPECDYKLLYFCDDFKKYVNSIKKNTFRSEFPKEPRLVIPFFNQHGKVIGLQGRLLEDPSKLMNQRNNNRESAGIRYFTVKLVDDSNDLIFGLERVDFRKPILALEGPIDSLFLPNSIAVMGSCYKNSIIKSIQSNLTIVPDNEKRNNEVCNQIESMIKLGYKVVLWPSYIEEKDINDMIKAGYSSDDLEEIICNNTVSGLTGLVKFKTWRQG